MAPKAKNKAAQALYKDPRNYYKAACRARINTLRPDWNRAEIEGTLAWLWRHVSEELKEGCRNLKESKSHNLPTIDDTTIPDTPKAVGDPAPAALPSSLAAPPAHHEGNYEEKSSQTATVPINTTAFAFIPDLANANDELPNMIGLSKSLTDEETLQWLDQGLLFPEKEGEDRKWNGAHILGQGSGGRVGLWVATDDTGSIIESIAVKDVFTRPDEWVSPINWRDQLPREIAVQVRLNEREAYNHHVHRYYGHRIDNSKYRHRIFNEVCDVGSLNSALEFYSRHWQLRRDKHRWSVMKLPHGEDSRQFWQDYLSHRRNHHFTTVPDHAPPTDAKAWEDNDIVIRRKWLETRFEEMDHMRNIMTWHNDEFPTKEPKYVIPESFLWKIFDNLAEAYLMLGRGEVGEPLGDEGPEHSGWQEMVHRDGHPGNIFIKSVDGALGRAVKSSGDYRYEIFQEKDAPTAVLADFDYTSFDLQSKTDHYADNPIHYVLGQNADWVMGGGRYAPEMWLDYEGHAGQRSHLQEKITSNTDVWQLGSLMFNLVMNMPMRAQYRGPFLYEGEDTAADILNEYCRIISSKPYSNTMLEQGLFSGEAPFEACNRYSDELKRTIIQCLFYRQSHRLSMTEVKSITSRYAGKEVPPGSKAGGNVIIRVERQLDAFQVGRKFTSLGKRKRTD